MIHGQQKLVLIKFFFFKVKSSVRSKRPKNQVLEGQIEPYRILMKCKGLIKGLCYTMFEQRTDKTIYLGFVHNWT